jgi:hypothetical protein
MTRRGGSGKSGKNIRIVEKRYKKEGMMVEELKTVDFYETSWRFQTSHWV